MKFAVKAFREDTPTNGEDLLMAYLRDILTETCATVHIGGRPHNIIMIDTS